MSAPWKQKLDDGTEVIRTCAWSPPGCHPVGCGLRLFVKDGELVKVEGDPDHPVTQGRLCPRCLAMKEYVYHPDRVLYPMKRAKEDRGKDKWERITWDEAYDIIAENFEHTVEKYGHEGIVNFVGTGRRACTLAYLITAVAFGSPNQVYSQSGWSCYGPRMAASAFLLGVGLMDVDYAAGFEKRYDEPEYVVPECIVIWGKDPLRSNPDGFFGHSIIDLMKRGTKIVNVDPRMNWLSTKAEYSLHVRPGTDTALGIAMLKVMIEEDLYDHDFVDKWCYGFDQLAERVCSYDLDWCAETTWVPREEIVAATRFIANAKPVSFCWGVAMDQTWNGVQATQCLIAMAALTGCLDIPGGSTLGIPSELIENVISGGVFQTYCDPEVAAKRIGEKEYPAVVSSMDTAHPDIMLECLETDEPYPIRMAVIQGSDTLTPTCSAQPKRHLEALKKMDFIMALDIFQTPMTMAVADLFLPVATFPETDGYVAANYGLNSPFIGAINKAIEVGEAKSELQIGLEIIERVNPGALPYPATQEDHLNASMGESVGSFANLKEQVTIQPGQVYHKYETGKLRPDGQPGFATPTGRVELYSTVYEHFGEDPLPYYMEPQFSPYSDLMTAEEKAEYPLILTTGARHYTSFHSEHRNIPSLREMTPDPLVEINPADAAKYGIKDGDWVTMENQFGSAQEVAKVTPIVPEGVINAAHGWWFPEEDPEEPSLYGVWKSNLNSMVPHRQIGKLGFGAPYKNLICKIYKSPEQPGGEA